MSDVADQNPEIVHGLLQQAVGAYVLEPAASVFLSISAEEATHGGPDDIVLAVGSGSHEHELARFDGHYQVD